MKKIYFITFIALNSIFVSAQLYTPGAGVTDIDGNTYQTIVINGEEWMAENLKTSKYANGTIIPHITDLWQWQLQTSGAWEYPALNSQFESVYCKLYNWYSVVDPRNVCPLGWHVPNDNEWASLINFLDPFSSGGSSPNNAGSKMKTPGIIDDGTGLWAWPNSGANNESGFTGLPAGQWSGNFSSSGFWWSTTEGSNSDTPEAWNILLENETPSAEKYILPKYQGLSIRCVKDNTSGVNEINHENNSLIKIYDFMGNETTIKLNEILFYLYSDGSVEKKIIFE
jgi:uncharacterized protein (TIGR02145 family)